MIATLIDLLRLTFSAPNEAMRRLKAFPLTLSEILQILLIIVVLEEILFWMISFQVGSFLAQYMQEMGIDIGSFRPISGVFFSFIYVFLQGWLLYKFGNLFKGVGEFIDALKFSLWFQILPLLLLPPIIGALLIVQGIGLISPQLGSAFIFVVMFGIISLSIWLLVLSVSFLKELHEFEETMPAIATLALTIIATLMISSVMRSIIF